MQYTLYEPMSIRIKLTKHCQQRIKDRDIDIKDIESVINDPVETFYDKERKNYKSFGKGKNPLRKEQPYLVLIHSKINSSVTIITSMWADKGGLKAIGFSKF